MNARLFFKMLPLIAVFLLAAPLQARLNCGFTRGTPVWPCWAGGRHEQLTLSTGVYFLVVRKETSAAVGKIILLE
jgi:hypothetical protein